MGEGGSRQRGEQEPYDPAEIAEARQASWLAVIGELFAPGRLDMDAGLHQDLARWSVNDLPGGAARNVLIAGGPGVGKTRQALCAVLGAYRHGWGGSAIYVHPARWRRVSRPPVDLGAVRAWEICDVLVLDDLGALRMGDWDLETLYMLLDERWRHNRPTVVVSNEGGLRAMLGDRISSRLAERALRVEIAADDPEDPDGSDWRRR